MFELEPLRHKNLKLNPENAFRKENIFFERECSESGVEPCAKLIKAVKDFFLRTQSIKQTQLYLGLANYYYRFIKYFARIANPIFKLVTKEAIFNWEVAFEKLKTKLSEYAQD